MSIQMRIIFYQERIGLHVNTNSMTPAIWPQPLGRVCANGLPKKWDGNRHRWVFFSRRRKDPWFWRLGQDLCCRNKHTVCFLFRGNSNLTPDVGITDPYIARKMAKTPDSYGTLHCTKQSTGEFLLLVSAAPCLHEHTLNQCTSSLLSPMTCHYAQFNSHQTFKSPLS